MATHYTSSDLREMRHALRAFREAYVAYIRHPSREAKAAVVRAMPEAELALLAGGGGGLICEAATRGLATEACFKIGAIGVATGGILIASGR